MIATWADPQQIAFALVITPLIAALPMGVGLFLLWGGRENVVRRFGRATFLIAAYVIGVTVLTSAFQIRQNLAVDGVIMLLPSALGTVTVSVLGFVGCRDVLRLDDSALRFIRVAGWAGALVVPWYLFDYWVLADYPLRDLFQETHFMKGIIEFARFDVLNPYTTSSYIPAVQVVEGLLYVLFEVDPLILQWTRPAVASVLWLTAIYGATRTIFEEERFQAGMIALALATANTFSLGNGNISAIAMIAVTELLLRETPNQEGRRVALGIAVVLSAEALAYLARSSATTVLAGLVGGVVALALLVRWRSGFSGTVLAALVVLAAIPLHRGTGLFVLIVLTVGLAPWLARHLLRSTRSNWLALTAGFALPVAFATAVAVITLAHFEIVSSEKPLWQVVFEGVRLLVGDEFGNQFEMGTGSDLAAVELARVTPPFEMAALTVGMLSVMIGRWRSAGHFAIDVPIGFLQRLVAVWTVGWLLALGILVGLPFFYRSGFLVGILFAVALVQISCIAHRQYGFRAVAVGGVAVATYGTLLAGAGVVLGTFGTGQHLPYLQDMWPSVLGAGICVAALGVGAGLTRNKRAGLSLLLAGLAASVFVDRQVLRVAFFGFTYGERPAVARTISHYTRLDLDVADRLRYLPRNTVLISDPYTMSLLRARTGLNIPVAIANLSTLSLRQETLLRETLRLLQPTDMAPDARRDMFCDTIRRLVRRGAGEVGYAYNAWHEDRQAKHMVEDDGEAMFLDPAMSIGRFWRIVGVINEKTLAWANSNDPEKPGYYPMNGRLSDEWLYTVIAPPFNLLDVVEGRVAVFEVGCDR